MTSFNPWRQSCACAALLCSTLATAQETVVITGNPLRRERGAEAASSLSGDALAARRASTLGETLDGLPGVAASGFGPNSSRPVIRGLDGDRVRLLDNGGASIDASNLSFDHAVAIDPLVVERIEVLRGPAALLYGGNATGGVVNTIDNRIPRAAISGLAGRADLRLGGASDERSAAVVLDGGVASGAAGGLAWHADVVGRRSSEQRVPLHTPVADGAALDPSTRVRNSAAEGHSAAFGAGWVGDSGYLGASVDTLRNQYGVTVEPDVHIRLQRDRLALAGERRFGNGFVRSVSVQGSSTRYRHQEVEGSGEVGTTFASQGQDLRLELRHAPVAGLEGVWGLQSERLLFSALGEEAFVPSTRTRSQALFVVEELPLAALTLSAGVRVEQARVASEGDAAGATTARFGSATGRRFQPTSYSLGARSDLPGGWQLLAALGHTERAPAYYELYADGVHLATAAYERGDPQQALERSRHAELGLAWRSAAHSLKANVFETRFSNFIALAASGLDITVPGAPGEPLTVVPEYRFQGVQARLRGIELEGRTRLLPGAVHVDLTASLDLLRGDSTQGPLPRIAPQRLRVGVEGGTARWQAGAEVRHVARQNRVSANDTPTDGYTMLDLWARGRLLPDGRLGWYGKLGNAGNALGYNAVAVATVRGLVPLPGRALALGLTARW